MTFILRNHLKKTGTGNSHLMQKKVKSPFQEHIPFTPGGVCYPAVSYMFTGHSMLVSHGEILLYPDFAQLYLSIAEASSLILARS
ncbi:hypothetical protein D5086_010001 [Populus alba]|uniref:Uncharacterized protein n=1 Tax=Populus alba TaxID=43335 RepID=A0ACC4C9N1_POPAL